jgi:hypothetical protein
MARLPAAPFAVARLGVGLAVCLLPSRAARERYRAEFLAELYGLPAGQQLRYTAGIWAQILPLRAAVGSLPDLAPAVPLGRWIQCHIARWHDWRTFQNDDGERYSACSICGRFPVDAFSRGAFGA